MKRFATIVFSLLLGNMFSQELISSATSVEFCSDADQCYTLKGPSYLFYDESKNAFYLKLDFLAYKISGDSTDNWLNNEADSAAPLYLKIDLQKENFPESGNQKVTSVKCPAQLSFYNKWQDRVVEMDIFGTENSLMNINVNSGTMNGGANDMVRNYDLFKTTFSFSFIPKEFKTYKPLQYLDQTITVSVTTGRINLLKPGMEVVLKDVYYQPDK